MKPQIQLVTRLMVREARPRKNTEATFLLRTQPASIIRRPRNIRKTSIEQRRLHNSLSFIVELAPSVMVRTFKLLSARFNTPETNLLKKKM